MFTADDIKQLREVIREEVGTQLDQKLEPIQKTLQSHDKMLRAIKKDQDTMLKMLDREQMSQRKHITDVEGRLDAVEDAIGITRHS
jgi:hypothetical protein